MHPFYTNSGVLFQLQAAAEKIHSLGGDAAGIKESALKKLEGNLVGIVVEMRKSAADTQLFPRIRMYPCYQFWDQIPLYPLYGPKIMSGKNDPVILVDP